MWPTCFAPATNLLARLPTGVICASEQSVVVVDKVRGSVAMVLPEVAACSVYARPTVFLARFVVIVFGRYPADHPAHLSCLLCPSPLPTAARRSTTLCAPSSSAAAPTC